MSILLQICGVLFLLSLAFMVYLIFFMPWTQEKITSSRQLSGTLIRGGFDKEQKIDVIFGEASYHPFLSDYEKQWCVELETVSISQWLQPQWQVGEKVHPVLKKIRKQTDVLDVSIKCFDKDYNYVQTLPILLLDVRTLGNKDRLNFSKTDGFEVMLYDRESRRVVFYGHQL